MTSLPMSIFLNIPELITYLQPLSCQIWGLLVQNFYCSILDLQHIHPTYLFVTAWLHKNERELLLSVSWNHPFLYQIRNTFTVVLWQVIAPSVRHQTSFPPFEASACHKHPFHFAAFLHIVRENSLTIRSETAYISAKLHNPNQIYIYKILTVRTSKSIISTLDSMARSISIARIATNTLLSWLTGNNSKDSADKSFLFSVSKASCSQSPNDSFQAIMATLRHHLFFLNQECFALSIRVMTGKYFNIPLILRSCS